MLLLTAPESIFLEYGHGLLDHCGSQIGYVQEIQSMGSEGLGAQIVQAKAAALLGQSPKLM